MDAQEPNPHFDAAARLVLAMKNEKIAAEFSAETLIERASQFIARLESEAETRNLVRTSE